ncbi:MAG: YhbY family RNA-binding protein [Gemmatimonadota bacterium]|nr:YhbY family RNA-binding protein [Gemmatimonadota bacterium]
MDSKTRATLRAQTHHLTALIHIGQAGVTPAVRKAVDDALRTKELVKLHVAKRENETLRDVVNDLAKKLRADVVQIIGNTTTLYRENPDLERKPGALPPWRR